MKRRRGRWRWMGNHAEPEEGPGGQECKSANSTAKEAVETRRRKLLFANKEIQRDVREKREKVKKICLRKRILLRRKDREPAQKAYIRNEKEEKRIASGRWKERMRG